MILTSEEIQLILQLISEKYGDGYADDPKVARLQGKLSIMLEAKSKAAELRNSLADLDK
jgi:hypothetical protein